MLGVKTTAPTLIVPSTRDRLQPGKTVQSILNQKQETLQNNLFEIRDEKYKSNEIHKANNKLTEILMISSDSANILKDIQI